MFKKLKEKWKDIPNSDGRYAISNKGRIRSYLRCVHGRFVLCKRPQRFLKLSKDKNGYLHSGLWLKGKHTMVKVHRMVAIVFIGKPRDNEVVCHKNNNKSDNSVSNLEWGTMYHNLVTGECPSLFKHGEENPAANLSNETVINIRNLAKTGKYIHREIADSLKLSRRNVSRIIQRKRWAHI